MVNILSQAKELLHAVGAAKTEREFFETVCAECGGIAKIPFKPVEGKSYYCSECFAQRQAAE